MAIRLDGRSILDSGAKWVYIEPRHIGAPLSDPPWECEPLAGVVNLQAVLFLPDRLKQRKAHAQSLQSWLKAGKAPATGWGRALTRLRENELQVLEGVCRFPSADAHTLAVLAEKRVSEIRACIQTLAKLGLVQALPVAAAHWLATKRGLALFAHCQGLDEDAAAQFLAFQAYVDSYTTMLPHNRIVLAFGVALRQAGLLENWSMDSGAQVFHGPGAQHRIVIKPDSHFVIRSQGRRYHFWLEVDRGNRRGASLVRALEKYFRIGLATHSDVRAIPPILYLVATGGTKRDAQHLKLVRQKLEALARHYPTSRPFLLLSTGELFAAAAADAGNARVWHTFQGGRYDAVGRSLHDVIGLGQKGKL